MANRKLCVALQTGLIALGIGVAMPALATEGGGSIYPVGVDSLAPGMLPSKPGTYWYHYSVFYDASRTDDAAGNPKPITPFSVDLRASAERFLFVSKKRVLGGTLIGQAIVPWADLKVRAGPAQAEAFSLGDVSLGGFILWDRKSLHYWFGVVQYAPTGQYKIGRAANIGRNYWATSLQAGVSYFPIPKIDVGVKAYLGFNGTNKATDYKSGNELILEYMLGYRLNRKVRFGMQGYYYDQVSADRLKQAVTAGGNEGRAFAIGPAIGVTVGRALIATKIQKEVMAENRPRGTRVWLQWMLPL